MCVARKKYMAPMVYMYRIVFIYFYLYSEFITAVVKPDKLKKKKKSQKL